MRAVLVLVALVGIAGARPEAKPLSLIRHRWQPVALPYLQPPATQLWKHTPPTASPPPTTSELPSEREITALEAQVSKLRGAPRLANLDQLVDMLAKHVRDDPFEAPLRARALAFSNELIAAPGFARFAGAPAALYRHGELQARADAPATYQRLITDYPSSTFRSEAEIWLGERAFERSKLVEARGFFESAIQHGGPRIAAFARYKLGWLAFNEMRFADAQRALEEVIAATAPGGVDHYPLRAAALFDLIAVYVEAGVPAQALEYFERLEPSRGLYRARMVAENYATARKSAHARIVYRELRTHETDPAHVCKASMGALRASLELGTRGEIAVDLAAFLPLARTADGTCKLIADELLGQVAIAWHRELLDKRNDAREVIEVWRSALAMSTEPPRRAAMLRNLAYAMWSHAAARGGDRVADWIAAAEALANAAERDAAVDAYDNALRVARGQSLAPMVLAQIKGGLTRLGTPRAKTLLGSLR